MLQRSCREPPLASPVTVEVEGALGLAIALPMLVVVAVAVAAVVAVMGVVMVAMVAEAVVVTELGVMAEVVAVKVAPMSLMWHGYTSFLLGTSTHQHRLSPCDRLSNISLSMRNSSPLIC